jgi:hypothetical protein
VGGALPPPPGVWGGVGGPNPPPPPPRGGGGGGGEEWLVNGGWLTRIRCKQVLSLARSAADWIRSGAD